MKVAYSAANNLDASLMPRLGVTLHFEDQFVEVDGLLDTGASINVLPYSIGLALGANWEQHRPLSRLSGNLGNYESRGLTVLATHPQLTTNGPLRLVFAWTQTDNTRLIFGQMNFFIEFNVCFYRSQAYFDINLK
jgi:hypothetical protein